MEEMAGRVPGHGTCIITLSPRLGFVLFCFVFFFSPDSGVEYDVEVIGISPDVNSGRWKRDAAPAGKAQRMGLLFTFSQMCLPLASSHNPSLSFHRRPLFETMKQHQPKINQLNTYWNVWNRLEVGCSFSILPSPWCGIWTCTSSSALSFPFGRIEGTGLGKMLVFSLVIV